MKAKLISIVTASFMIGCGGGGDAASTASAIATPTATPSSTPYSYCGGNGTSSSPYQICDQTSFSSIGSNPSSSFILTSNITLVSTSLGMSAFSGIIDGNSKTVTGLTIASPWVITNSGTIKNLIFQTLTMTNSNQSIDFGIIGVNSGTVNGVQFLSGTITATSTASISVGGIIGVNQVSGAALNLYSNGTVNGVNLTSSLNAPII